MAERKQITLIYSYNDNWIGGTYYILNIIKALNTLDDDLKPLLLILHSKKSSISPINEISYPYISFMVIDLRLSFFERLVNKFFYHLDGRMIFKITLPKGIGENVYPLAYNVSNKNIAKGRYWIADLQEYFLPEFFSNSEIRSRKAVHKSFVKDQSPIVFSSKTALQDFDSSYPNNSNQKYVLNFASFIDKTYKEININELLGKFNIAKPYFIVSNQFWLHKNHKVVLNALKFFKGTEYDFQLVFTGKESDYRNPEYFESLKNFIKENELGKYILSLGFIERNEQLQLMSNAIAIIQPSLFEGWSTVVEDAKAVNKYILVSDIPLHREQINFNCDFFDPKDDKDLAQKMMKTLDVNPKITPYDYGEKQKQVAKDFLRIFE
ncbi:glycosyltransferase [Pedobacter sp. GR22-10]|uniref:glycosyltransferase n=1 Tax=Pedobacter sp. GR22-10 TaxID=2994472 RepID=UPI0022482214|nr:glycosyltransferase [Pedobacter sp. GR22-10]MCX2432363.1 glycosyltransferase [Pedobacter sp. GR22-10]